MIPELLGYLLTGVECPTGWNGATVEDNCYYQKYWIQKKLARFYNLQCMYKEFKLFLNILMWRKMLQVPSKNLHIALLSGVWASAKPLSDRVGVVRGLVVVTTVSCRQLGTLSSLLPGGEVE